MNDAQGSASERSIAAGEGRNPVDQSARVTAWEKAIFAGADRLNPFIDFARPYVDGLENLPRDGRFLLVGNHTVVGSMAETVMIPYVVHRELGVRVRGLADKAMTRMPSPVADIFEAAGAVVGTPANGAALMANGETVLVFPGGGREMPKFKGEEYQLNWEGRSGFARLAIAHGYPIVPAASVGGDDIYHATIRRDGLLGRAGQLVGKQLFGRSDVAIPPDARLGPHPHSRPQAHVSAVRAANQHNSDGRLGEHMGGQRQGADQARSRARARLVTATARDRSVPKSQSDGVESGASISAADAVTWTGCACHASTRPAIDQQRATSRCAGHTAAVNPPTALRSTSPASTFNPARGLCSCAGSVHRPILGRTDPPRGPWVSPHGVRRCDFGPDR
ncbi:acyltransferase-like protein [Arthrobacter sp. SLBN-53]|nr:acyltransferase-like protein [Arthrobacter sp. SLBN-53]